MISETTARQLGPSPEAAIGRFIRLGGEARRGPLARRVAAEIDPDVIVETAPVEVHLALSLSGSRFLVTLFSILTTLALGLPLLGVFGVLSSFVARERGQIAVRMTMGASRGRVRGWLAGKVLTPTILGLALGLAGSYPLSRLLAGQLAGVEPFDVTARGLAALVILVAILFATWLPLARTDRIEPSEILETT